jgi:hypothetical protein
MDAPSVQRPEVDEQTELNDLTPFVEAEHHSGARFARGNLFVTADVLPSAVPLTPAEVSNT